MIEDKHIEAAVAVLRSCLHNGASVRLVYQDGEIQTIVCNSPSDFEDGYQALSNVKFNQVTYVDLLKTEKDQTRAAEYIEIIDQKSQRFSYLRKGTKN